MSTYNEIRERLMERNPAALLADGLEGGLVGIAERCGQPALAVYDVEKCAEWLMKKDNITYEEAVEFLEFNSVGAWVGENTPVWLYR